MEIATSAIVEAQQPHVNFNIPSATVTGSLEFPGRHGDSSLVGMATSAIVETLRNPMVVSKSHRSPIRSSATDKGAL